MQPYAEVRVGVFDDADLSAGLDDDVQFLFGLADDGRGELFAAEAFAAGEFPQAAEEAFGFAFVDEELAGFPDQADGDDLQRELGGFFADGEFVLQAAGAGNAVLSDRAGQAQRISRKANGCAQFHHRLVEVAGIIRIQKFLGAVPELGAGFWL